MRTYQGGVSKVLTLCHCEPLIPGAAGILSKRNWSPEGQKGMISRGYALEGEADNAVEPGE
ncbi:MAG: hypothetical protein K8I29_06695, partial [Alphaproteobacteria bacterium]|nr:hypothetical protein [Candidatus Nitrobium versatile]